MAEIISDGDINPGLKHSPGLNVSTDIMGPVKNSKYSNHPVLVVYENPTDRLYFQTIPETLDYDPQTNLVALSSFGRNVTNYQFTGAEDTLKFDLSLYSDVEDGSDVIRTCKWLESLSKDRGDGKGMHSVVLCFGKMYSSSRWVLQVAFSYKNFDSTKGMYPKLAIAHITLKKISTSNPSIETIRQLNS